MSRYRVWCAATKPLRGTQGSFCGFSGYREAPDRQTAQAKPCPRCGDTVCAARRYTHDEQAQATATMAPWSSTGPSEPHRIITGKVPAGWGQPPV